MPSPFLIPVILLNLLLAEPLLGGPVSCSKRTNRAHQNDNSVAAAVSLTGSSSGSGSASVSVGISVGTGSGSGSGSKPSGCFPSLGFNMPSSVPSSLDGWWCDTSSEYAFVGFSYEVTACQSAETLKSEFQDIRNRFNGRYVRLYGACDRGGFYDDVVEAAWEAGVGVHALIWFGYDGGDQWKQRRDSLVSTIKNNPKAPFVTRVIQFGSEPLFDGVISPDDLASQVWGLKNDLSAYKIPVTVSDMVYAFQNHGGASQVISAIDMIDIHTLPFFAGDASTGNNAFPLITRDFDWLAQNGQGKKVYLSENGWPSQTSSGVQANSGAAVADVWNEQAYFDLLDSQCQYFKNAPNGGIGWFAHIYSDSQEPGYGIVGFDGQPKFHFQPQTSC